MKTVIVMAVHGAPPNDFPREELREFFSLHSRLEASAVSHSPALESRYEELENKLKTWPRTPQNDPYHAASYELAGSSQTRQARKLWWALMSSAHPASKMFWTGR